jgi:hypothetical protein
MIVHIQNYSNSTTNKTWLSRSNIPADFAGLVVGLWRATPAAITTIQFLTTTADTFTSGTTFTLYGIKAK